MEWRLVFWIMIVIMTMSSLVYLLFGSGETQQWDDPEQFYQKEKKKEKSGLVMDERISLLQSESIEHGKLSRY